MRILIIEDEIASRRGLIDLLKNLGPQYKVVGVAGNGVEGLNKLRMLKPDLAFVDIRMPAMDGLTMIAEAHKQGVSAVYIIISAYAEFSYARKAMVQGVLDYLVKPFTLEDIENVLKRAAAAMPSREIPEEISVRHPMVSRTLQIIAEQYQTRLSLESIGEQLHITSEYLCYLFKRDMGVNFINYLRNYRIGQAIRLMQREDDLKIYEVASAVGFSDAKYFCRVFRNVTGQSPSGYVKKQIDGLQPNADEL